MPLYEYACPKCGTFELMQGIKEPTLKTHEKCGSLVERLISRSSFTLKGSGWYSDGYKTASANSGASKR